MPGGEEMNSDNPIWSFVSLIIFAVVVGIWIWDAAFPAVAQQSKVPAKIQGSVPGPIYSVECGGQCNVCGYDVICKWSCPDDDKGDIAEFVLLPPNQELKINGRTWKLDDLRRLELNTEPAHWHHTCVGDMCDDSYLLESDKNGKMWCVKHDSR
jgi:hypothetical protein